MKASTAAVISAASLLSIGISGCDSESTSSSASTSVASTSAAATSPATIDYASLLIKPTDIDEGWSLKNTKPEQNGIIGIFGNREGTEKITSAVVVREDADTAAAGIAAAKQGVSQQAGGAAFTPTNIGVSGGVLEAPGNTTVVAFAEGKAFVILEFASTTGERVPAEVAIAIAEKQDAVIKANVK